MQIILPLQFEGSASYSEGAPPALLAQVLPLAEVRSVNGEWGNILVQSIRRKDYTIWFYYLGIKVPSFVLHTLKALDGYGLMICVNGQLGGSPILNEKESIILYLREGIRNQWLLNEGNTLIVHIDLDDAFSNITVGTENNPAWLSRRAQALLLGLKANLLSQAAPELYLDGVVAELLQEHVLQVNEQQDHRLLHSPPFHFTAKDLATTRRVKALLDAPAGRALSLKQLAALANTNTDLIKKGFKYVYGQTVHQYWLLQSLSHAKDLLLSTKLPVKGIASACGFENYPHFIQQFKRHFGTTPGRLRKTS